MDNRWTDIYSKHSGIIDQLLLYSGEDDRINIKCYYDIVSGYILELLAKNPDYYLSEATYSLLSLTNSEIIKGIPFTFENGNLKFVEETKNWLDNVYSKCFDKEHCDFIKQLCKYDIVEGNKVAPDILSLLNSILLAIIVDSKGEEELFSIILSMRNGSNSNKNRIQDKLSKEIKRCGSLIYGRLPKYKEYNRCFDRVNISDGGEGQLNYLTDELYCQSAIMHIGVEETNSSGTGFLISNGFALTCAHVVEGAKEIYANVIVGDGYPTKGFEEFGIYDVGYGEVIYNNEFLDIALLKTEYCGSNYLEIETEGLLPELGEEVVVLGYPLGYEMPQTNKFGPNISYYRGYVSSNQVKDGISVTFLDIDVKSGNSGSPVISTKTGKVIGIVSGIKLGGRAVLTEKMPYMIPIQHFTKINKQ